LPLLRGHAARYLQMPDLLIGKPQEFIGLVLRLDRKYLFTHSIRQRIRADLIQSHRLVDQVGQSAAQLVGQIVRPDGLR
jgi:hypothetical protein